MRKFLFICLTLLTVWVICARCFIMQNRWSDGKAQRIFHAKRVDLHVHDSLIGNRHIHYAITGPDTLPTMVFIHGSPGSWMNYAIYMWDPSLRKRFRMVSIDRPGFGYSDFGRAAHLQEQASLILPVLRSLKNDKPMYLMGHSMGGPLVVDLAAREPHLFNTIVIVAGALDLKQESKETWRQIMDIKPLTWLMPGAFAPSNTELLFLKQDLIPLRESFPKVRANVVFIHGDKDTWVPIENIGYGTKMMTNATRITADTIAGADHMIPWKNREDLRKILLALP